MQQCEYMHYCWYSYSMAESIVLCVSQENMFLPISIIINIVIEHIVLKYIYVNSYNCYTLIMHVYLHICNAVVINYVVMCIYYWIFACCTGFATDNMLDIKVELILFIIELLPRISMSVVFGHLIGNAHVQGML